MKKWRLMFCDVFSMSLSFSIGPIYFPSGFGTFEKCLSNVYLGIPMLALFLVLLAYVNSHKPTVVN